MLYGFWFQDKGVAMQFPFRLQTNERSFALKQAH